MNILAMGQLKALITQVMNTLEYRYPRKIKRKIFPPGKYPLKKYQPVNKYVIEKVNIIHLNRLISIKN